MAVLLRCSGPGYLLNLFSYFILHWYKALLFWIHCCHHKGSYLILLIGKTTFVNQIKNSPWLFEVLPSCCLAMWRLYKLWWMTSAHFEHIWNQIIMLCTFYTEVTSGFTIYPGALSANRVTGHNIISFHKIVLQHTFIIFIKQRSNPFHQNCVLSVLERLIFISAVFPLFRVISQVAGGRTPLSPKLWAFSCALGVLNIVVSERINTLISLPLKVHSKHLLCRSAVFPFSITRKVIRCRTPGPPSYAILRSTGVMYLSLICEGYEACVIPHQDGSLFISTVSPLIWAILRCRSTPSFTGPAVGLSTHWVYVVFVFKWKYTAARLWCCRDRSRKTLFFGAVSVAPVLCLTPAPPISSYSTVVHINTVQ